MSWKTALLSVGWVLGVAVAIPVLAVENGAGDTPDVTVRWMARSASPSSVAQDTLGKSIFTSKGLCHACHGPDAKGTALAPDLTDDTWLNIDGELESIVELVKTGVPSPKSAPAPMPPMGGARLTDEEVQAVARYVYSLSQKAS